MELPVWPRPTAAKELDALFNQLSEAGRDAVLRVINERKWAEEPTRHHIPELLKIVHDHQAD